MQGYRWPLMKNTLSFMDRVKLAKFVLTSDKFTQGKKVQEFEDAWSNWIGSKHSLFVTSGSTANFLLVAAVIEKYGLKPGDKWCLCISRWLEAEKVGKAPNIILEATHEKTLDYASLELLIQYAVKS